MTSPRPSNPPVVNFGALIDQWRVLPTTYSWSSVRQSIRRIEEESSSFEGARSPEFQEHAVNVVSFAETITAHAELIAYALACAAGVSRLAKTKDAAQLCRALEVISTAYDFKSLSTLAVHNCLRRVWAGLRFYQSPIDPNAKVPPISLPPGATGDSVPPLSEKEMPAVRTEDDVVEYFEWLKPIMAAAMESPDPTVRVVLGPRIQDDAWDSIASRFEDVLRDRTASKPEVAEVIAKACDFLPASVISFDGRPIPATAWARLVVPTPIDQMMTPIPGWMHGLAASALGFRAPQPRLAAEIFAFLAALPWTRPALSQSDATLQFNDYITRHPWYVAPRPETPTIIVIRKTADSMVADWPVSATMATLPLTKSQVDVLLAARGTSGEDKLPTAMVSSNHMVIAVERPADATDIDKMAHALRNTIRRSTQPGQGALVAVVSFGPEQQTAPERFILAPARYDDLVPADLFVTPTAS